MYSALVAFTGQVMIDATKMCRLLTGTALHTKTSTCVGVTLNIACGTNTELAQDAKIPTRCIGSKLSYL